MFFPLFDSAGYEAPNLRYAYSQDSSVFYAFFLFKSSLYLVVVALLSTAALIVMHDKWDRINVLYWFRQSSCGLPI